MHNEDWKSGSAPTIEDVLKYKQTKAKLLIGTEYMWTPFEGYIHDVIEEGEYVQLGSAAQQWAGQTGIVPGNWNRREDIRVLALLDKPQPVEKVAPQPQTRSGMMNLETIESVRNAMLQGIANAPSSGWSEKTCEPPRKLPWWKRLPNKKL